MELKDFIKKALIDLVNSVEEVRKESDRDMYLTDTKENRTVEFDIAVTVEKDDANSGRAGIKIFQIIEGGGNISKEIKNSSVSRIKFGVYVNRFTKQEEAQQRAEIEANNETNFDKSR